MDGTSFFPPLAARARVGGRSVATTLGREPQRCRGGQRFFMEMANVLSRCPWCGLVFIPARFSGLSVDSGSSPSFSHPIYSTK